MPVLDINSGKILEYRQVHKHPNYTDTWNRSYSNKLGRLCQGIGTDPNNKFWRVPGTNTFFIIDYENIPAGRRNEITYSKVVY